MCNYWHDTSKYKPKKIKQSGKGYKIVRVSRRGNYLPIRLYGRFRNKKNGFFVRKNYDPSIGFCFFTSKKMAEKALESANYWLPKPNKIVPIQYKEGIGSCLTDDDSWDKDVRFAFCKEFRFI